MGGEVMGDEVMGGEVFKADTGKPKVSLVPMQIVKDIAVIREYGNNKYGTVDGWKTIDPSRFIDALGRHALAFLEEPLGVDEESGLPHLWHLECNAAFLSELLKGELKSEVKTEFKGEPGILLTAPVQAEKVAEEVAEVVENTESNENNENNEVDLANFTKDGKPRKNFPSNYGNLVSVSRDTLYELYVVKGYPACEIARLYECDTRAVQSRLKKEDIFRTTYKKNSESKEEDAPKFKIEAYLNGAVIDSYESDKINKAGEFYNDNLKKGYGVRLYLEGERKSISEAERIFYPYIKKNKHFTL